MLNDISVSDVRQFQFFLPKEPKVDSKEYFEKYVHGKLVVIARNVPNPFAELS